MKAFDYFPNPFKDKGVVKTVSVSSKKKDSIALFNVLDREKFGTPSTMNKSRKLRVKRVEQLETAVRKSPILYSGLNLRSRIPFGKGYTLECEDEEALEACEKLGANSGLDVLCRTKQFSLDSFGYGGWENVFWDANGNLVDAENALVRPIDPKYIDYQRTVMGDIVLDKKTGQPQGYTFSTTGDWDLKNTKDLRLEQVAFRVNNPYGGFEPYTITDSLFDVITYIANNNQNMAQWASTKAFPTLKLKVGDKDHPPSEEQFNAAKDIQDFETHNDWLVHSGLVEVSEIDVGNVRDIIRINDPFIEQVTAVTAIPKPFLLGVAEGTELATSRSQMQTFIDSMEDLQHLMGRDIENNVFKVFCDLHGFKKVPKVRWNPIDTTGIIELGKAARYLVGMRFEQPMISVEEARRVIGKNIPLDDKFKWDGGDVIDPLANQEGGTDEKEKPKKGK